MHFVEKCKCFQMVIMSTQKPGPNGGIKSQNPKKPQKSPIFIDYSFIRENYKHQKYFPWPPNVDFCRNFIIQYKGVHLKAQNRTKNRKNPRKRLFYAIIRTKKIEILEIYPEYSTQRLSAWQNWDSRRYQSFLHHISQNQAPNRAHLPQKGLSIYIETQMSLKHLSNGRTSKQAWLIWLKQILWWTSFM